MNTVSEVKPGVFFSPGFYMAFWENAVLKQFDTKTILTHQKFKPYREMWLGAIMAASQTKGLGIKHYVGMPNDEPRDVDIVTMEETKNTPSGKTGTTIQRLYVQITRCNLDAGEDIVAQILKKNKPAYGGIILAVYVHGFQAKSNFDEVHKALSEVEKIYPSEILVIELAEATEHFVLPTGTYGLTRVYPKIGQNIVNINDEQAFFRNPEVFKGTGLGVSTEWQDLGSFTLMPPKI